MLCHSRIFLLSPANLAGIRAGYVTRPDSVLDLACRLRQQGASLGELFSFISGLYFRGKLAYAQAFGACSPPLEGSFVITPTAGLISPETIVTLDRLREIAANDIDPSNQRYRAPLDRDCRKLSEMMSGSCEVVLLGSIATPKYVEPLLHIFGERLLFPAEFVGRGDLSRGGLMLRCVETANELAYIPILRAIRRGPRPLRLPPLVNPHNKGVPSEALISKKREGLDS